MIAYSAPDLAIEEFSVEDVLTVSNPITVAPATESTTQPTTGSSISVGGGGDGYIDYSDVFGS